MAETPERRDARTPPPVPSSRPAVSAEADELPRRLSQRQLTMLAIGGAIGVGLFLGSSVTIHLAGPGVIVIGAALILGFGPGPAIGLSNLTAHGGFLPFGWKGVGLALTLAITSYMGVEV